MKTYFQNSYTNPDGGVRTGQVYLADKDFQDVQMSTVQRKMKTIKWPDDIRAVTVSQKTEEKDHGKKAAMTIIVPKVNLSKQEWD